MATRFGRKGRKGTTEEPENTTSDKTKVDATEAVKEAGTDVYDTKSGYRLPDGTLVSYEEQDDEAAGPAVDDGTTAVEQAVQERLADDGPEAVPAATEAEIETAIVGAPEIDPEFAGQSFELAEDALAQVIGQTSSEDEAGGLLGRIGREAVDKGKPGQDLLEGGEEGEPEAPFSDRPAEFQAGPDVREAGVFDLIDQPGASDGDPLSSFLDAAEAKLGRDTGLATPADDADDAPTFGKDSIAYEGTYDYFKPAPGSNNPDGSYRGHKEFHYYTHDKDSGQVTIVSEPVSPEGKAFTFVYDPATKTGTYIADDGSTATTHADGTVTHEPAPPKADDKKEDDKKEDDKKEDEKPKGDGAEGTVGSSLDPDYVDPKEKAHDPEVQRLRKLREQGPDSGDGATDPADDEIEGEVSTGAELPTHAELGQQLFGQPPPEGTVSSGGGANFNPGADSQGAGVITPQDDQNVATGPRRNDDPFEAAGPAPKPVAAEDAAADEGGESFLPSSEIAGPVDDGPDLPDTIDLPD